MLLVVHIGTVCRLKKETVQVSPVDRVMLDTRSSNKEGANAESQRVVSC